MNVTLRTWLWATAWGWVLGIPLVVLFALGGEAAGLGGLQVLVGFGIGAGVGVMQGRALRVDLGRAWPWALSTTLCLSLPFFVTDVGRVRGWALSYSLPVCVVVGGLLSGGAQALLMRRRAGGVMWWPFVSALGWLLAASTTELARVVTTSGGVRGLLGAALYLFFSAAGGPVLGLVTGVVLRRLPARGA